MIRYKYAVTFLSSVCFVVFLGLTTDARLKLITSTHDKLAHCIVFCIETVLFTMMFESDSVQLQAFIPQRLRSRILAEYEPFSMNKYLLAFIVCCVCASTGSEFAQQFFSRGKRTFDVNDMFANFSGSLLGLGIAYKIEQQIQHNYENR
ncbi:hypothetical protein KDRO_F08010 [Kluyveromyces lactis]|nr:hypothetical protein KDRO_F08010 [Kluyveromyces lactis]